MKRRISQLMFERYQDSQPVLPAYNDSADVEWIRAQSKLPWLRLAVDIPRQTILDEIGNITSLVSLHREEYGEHQGWKSFCIHGKSYDATREEAHYHDTRPYIWTPEAETLMPQTVDYFKTKWPGGDYKRIRVMLIEPGGYVSIHRDYDTPHLSAINIAITQPSGCKFVMEKHGTVPFTEGSAYWVDISNHHTVFNNSNQMRWHVIVHQAFDNNEFQKLVVNSYKQLYNNSNEDSHDYNSR